MLKDGFGQIWKKNVFAITVKKSHLWFIIRYCLWRFQQVGETTRDQSEHKKYPIEPIASYIIFRSVVFNFETLNNYPFQFCTSSRAERCFMSCCAAKLQWWKVRKSSVFKEFVLSSTFYLKIGFNFGCYLFRMKFCLWPKHVALNMLEVIAVEILKISNPRSFFL